MNEPKLSDLDLYINDIVEKLRAKYGYADKNRLMINVRFAYRDVEPDECGLNYYVVKFIELTYTELEESMNKKELPNQIKELL